MLQNGHQIIVFLTSIGVGGVAVSLATKLLKKLTKGHLDQDIHKVVLALTAIAGYAQYAGQLHSVLPPTVLGVSASSIYGVSQLAYKLSSGAISVASKIKASNDGQAMPATPGAPITSETPATPTQASF